MKPVGMNNLIVFGLALGLAVASAARSAAPTEAPPALRLQSMGMFYIGGQRIESPYSDERDATFPTSGRSTVAGQAKVTYLLPEQSMAPAIVLVPGAGLSSSIYLGTPDGREGWAQYFARRGHAVYVVDLPDRSTAGFPIDTINGCAHGDGNYACGDVATATLY